MVVVVVVVVVAVVVAVAVVVVDVVVVVRADPVVGVLCTTADFTKPRLSAVISSETNFSWKSIWKIEGLPPLLIRTDICI